MPLDVLLKEMKPIFSTFKSSHYLITQIYIAIKTAHNNSKKHKITHKKIQNFQTNNINMTLVPKINYNMITLKQKIEKHSRFHLICMSNNNNSQII